jgi:hypothetical protein
MSKNTSGADGGNEWSKDWGLTTGLRPDAELATLVTKNGAWLDEFFSKRRHTTTKSEMVPYFGAPRNPHSRYNPMPIDWMSLAYGSWSDPGQERVRGTMAPGCFIACRCEQPVPNNRGKP